jgi:endonuclease III
MLLAQLSANRPWKPIQRNLDRLARVFGNYEPDFLMAAAPGDLADAVKSLKCGNRQIVRQMGALADNIRTMQRIDIEDFVVTMPPIEIAKLLSEPGAYKLKYIGFALACEYLRNVGVDFAKPDVHINRIIGPRRLALAPTENERDVLEAMSRLAEGSRHCLTYIDNLIWLYCADGYGAICNANPSCGICGLAACCNQDRM